MTAPVVDRREAAEFAALAALDRRTVTQILDLWALLDLDDLQGSFVNDVLPDAGATMVEAQAQAATIGGSYVDAEAVSLGARVGARLDPWGFAGTASDGRSLVGLLVQPFVQTLDAMRLGAPPELALQAGAEALDRIVTTQVQDAGRTAEATGIAGNRDVKGYLRAVEPGACSRCLILAGRFYKFNDGFDRHPSCRCSHRPLTRESEPQSPLELFNGLSTAEQDRVFTKAGADSIRLGADPALVVNARRGMSKAQSGRLTRVNVGGQQVFTSTEGTSKRGLAYQRLTDGATGRKRKVTRLMPESIIDLAKDRDDAIRLLRLHGYII